MIAIYFGTLFGLLIYSYSLVDPNLTLLNHPVWAAFRDVMVQFGYYNREVSGYVFILFITAISVLHIKINKRAKIHPMTIALGTGVMLLMSYPFLSRDFFNYMFDARILTLHGANPYLHAALDFPQDHWLRFMHWTHRSYPYGPTFLPLTLIPSFLSMGKLLLNFVFFKGMWVVFYLLTVWILTKIKHSYALFFATHPLVLMEGLVNAHNDFIAISLGIIGIYYLYHRKKDRVSQIIGLLFIAASAGIKFITAPLFLLLYKKLSHEKLAYISMAVMALLISYISYTGEVQQWYFLNFLVCIPFAYTFLKKWDIFSYGILLSYYPFIRYGDWSSEKLVMKHSIIYGAFLLNLLWFFYTKRTKKL